MGNSPHRSKQSVFVVRCPPGHEDPYGFHGRYGDYKENPDVEIGEESLSSEGYYGEHEQGRDHHGHGREGEYQLVRACGDDVLLGHNLYGVGYGLKNAEWPDSIGPDPVLEPAKQSPFEIDENGNEHHRNVDEHQYAEQPEHQVGDPALRGFGDDGLDPPANYFAQLSPELVEPVH